MGRSGDGAVCAVRRQGGEFGLEPGEHVGVPVLLGDTEYHERQAFDRCGAARRRADAERQLRRLGLDLPFETFLLGGDPGQFLLTYTAEPTSPTEDALNLLTAWAAN